VFGREIAYTIGMTCLVLSVAALGPWLAGRVFDATGSYRGAFLAAVCTATLSATGALGGRATSRPRALKRPAGARVPRP
jgi:cyanate permease